MASCTASPCTKTALYASLTDASGWLASISIGWTLASIPSGVFLATPRSLITQPISLAYWISVAVILVIPSVYTSSKVTRELKAALARIATFLPASSPSTSAVGSLSAYPSSCASFRASANSMPFWLILVRIKLVVPFMIPITSEIWFPARHCLIGRMIGIPPATAASCKKSFLFFAAVSSRICPSAAIRSLLAVTTFFPASRASRIYVLAGSMPPISSITISISGSSTISFQLSVSKDGSSIFLDAFSILRTRIFFNSTFAPNFGIISSSCIFSTL